MTVSSIEDAARLTYSGLPLEEAIEWEKRMPDHSTLSFQGELTYIGYKYVPCSWIFCTEDKILPPSFQQECIDRIEEASGKKVYRVELVSDHCPMASFPIETAEAIHTAIVAA
jgi:hypothetical protein